MLARVQFSQPRQCWTVLRVELQRLAIAGDRAFGVAEALVVDLSDPAVDRSLFARLVDDVVGAEAALVDLDDARPVTREEQQNIRG